MFFSTSKILDRATERNKTQKYVEITVKGPRPEFVRLLEKWPLFERRFSWKEHIATDDKVKMPSYPIKQIGSSYISKGEDITLKFSEDEIKFHKFAEDHNLSWTIIPTSERTQNPDEYFNNSWECTIGRTDLVMRNFFDFLRKTYKDILFSYDESYTYDGSHIFKAYIEEIAEKTESEIKNFYMDRFSEWKLWDILRELYDGESPSINIVIKKSAPRKLKTKALTDCLKDQYGVKIEKDDIVAYPYGSSSSFYGLSFSTVESWTDEMVSFKSGGRRRHDKIMVIQSKNKNKILAFQEGFENGQET